MAAAEIPCVAPCVLSFAYSRHCCRAVNYSIHCTCAHRASMPAQPSSAALRCCTHKCTYVSNIQGPGSPLAPKLALAVTSPALCHAAIYCPNGTNSVCPPCSKGHYRPLSQGRVWPARWHQPPDGQTLPRGEGRWRDGEAAANLHRAPEEERKGTTLGCLDRPAGGDCGIT